jgi:hypothetical protein
MEPAERVGISSSHTETSASTCAHAHSSTPASESSVKPASSSHPHITSFPQRGINRQLFTYCIIGTYRYAEPALSAPVLVYYCQAVQYADCLLRAFIGAFTTAGTFIAINIEHNLFHHNQSPDSFNLAEGRSLADVMQNCLRFNYLCSGNGVYSVIE